MKPKRKKKRKRERASVYVTWASIPKVCFTDNSYILQYPTHPLLEQLPDKI